MKSWKKHVARYRREVIPRLSRGSTNLVPTDNIEPKPIHNSYQSEEHTYRLLQAIKDWQICHGSLLKHIWEEQAHTSLTYPVGVTIFPSTLPRNLFEQACNLQILFNELYVAVSQDYGWLQQNIAGLATSDPLAASLWKIYETTRSLNQGDNTATGIFRSDYMLHEDVNGLHLKQVEMNTISCAGAVHCSRVSDMHKHLQRTTMFDGIMVDSNQLHLSEAVLAPNYTHEGLVSSLAKAHDHYGQARSPRTEVKSTCILMIVQPRNFNVADERPLEHDLWSLTPSIPVFRVEWAQEILTRTMLTSNNILLYHPPHQPETTYEVSLVYYRAGFEAHEYSTSSSQKIEESIGFKARLRLEQSLAIRCPPISMHLTTFKKVQQALTQPGAVERFLPADKACKLRSTFMPIFPLDDSDLGRQGRIIALDSKLSKGYVLKPSREGGGHNIYRGDIPIYLKSIKQERWCEFVLMELIRPPRKEGRGNGLVSANSGVYWGETICELGIWGSCLWEEKSSRSGEVDIRTSIGEIDTLERNDMGEDESNSAQILDRNSNGILFNEQIGWSARTKRADVDEMSVVKGYGCFDSIALI